MLSAIETIALSKAIKDTAAKDARGRLAEGHHDVDFTVRVSGPLLVAPPTPATLKETVPTAALIGLILDQLTPAARKKVEESFVARLDGWRAGVQSEVPAREPSTLAAERLLALARRERLTTRAGNVTAPLTVEVIGRAVAA